MSRIKVGDIIKFKSFKYLKTNHPDRFLWRMFEISNRVATIISIENNGTYIVKMEENTAKVPNMNDFPVTIDMFDTLSKEELKFRRIFHLNKD